MQAARGTPLSQASDSASSPEATRPPRRLLLFAALAAVVYALDLLTKTLAVAQLEGREPVSLLGGLLTLRLTRNPGAAFSLGTGYTVALTVVAIGVVVVVVRLSSRLRSAGWAVALGLLLGGACGNLTDRLVRAPGPMRGHVVDFIDYGGLFIGNVADIALVGGAAFLVLLTLLGVEPGRRPG